MKLRLARSREEMRLPRLQRLQRLQRLFVSFTAVKELAIMLSPGLGLSTVLLAAAQLPQLKRLELQRYFFNIKLEEPQPLEGTVLNSLESLAMHTSLLQPAREWFQPLSGASRMPKLAELIFFPHNAECWQTTSDLRMILPQLRSLTIALRQVDVLALTEASGLRRLELVCGGADNRLDTLLQSLPFLTSLHVRGAWLKATEVVAMLRTAHTSLRSVHLYHCKIKPEEVPVLKQQLQTLGLLQLVRACDWYGEVDLE